MQSSLTGRSSSSVAQQPDVLSMCLTLNTGDSTHSKQCWFCVVANRRKIFCWEKGKTSAQHGVKTGIYYPRPLHLQEAYHELGYQKGDFPIAEYLSETLFALPLFPFLTFQEQNQVITALRCFEEVNGCFI